jgi:translation initiation factor 3 subunit A
MAGRGYGPRGGGFARPENALKRAEELENVGQKGNALQVLHDVITSRKHRTWSAHYEKIMLKHIDLVVELKKRNYGKEALMQYRNMCQAVNIASLESVIQYYLKRASDKAEEAQSKAAVSSCVSHRSWAVAGAWG